MLMESKLKGLLFFILYIVVIFLAGHILESKHHGKNWIDFSEESRKINPLGESQFGPRFFEVLLRQGRIFYQ